MKPLHWSVDIEGQVDSLIDSLYQVETPENIDLEAELAGPVVRILAFAMDFVYRGIILICLALILAILGKSGFGLTLIVSFLLEWFYPVAYEVLRHGQTPGKKVMQIMVVNDDLSPVTFSNSVVRNLVRAADFLPFFYLIGLIAMVGNTRFQRLGDMAAGTLVVYKNDIKPDLKIPEIPATPPPVPLELDEQIAIINFSQSHEKLSPARQMELADILVDFPGGKEGERIKHLQGIGNWLVGDK